MSRTRKGSKPPGYEVSSRRPHGCYTPPGKVTKRFTAKAERAQARQQLHHSLSSS